jgi:hypothetical protein
VEKLFSEKNLFKNFFRDEIRKIFLYKIIFGKKVFPQKKIFRFFFRIFVLHLFFKKNRIAFFRIKRKKKLQRTNLAKETNHKGAFLKKKSERTYFAKETNYKGPFLKKSQRTYCAKETNH